MTDAIGPSVSDVVRALTEARQANNRSISTPATQTAPAGRSGHEGDRVTLSEAAQEVVKVRRPDGTVTEARLLTGLKPITPEGMRSDAEAALKQLMADLGMEGDLEFSIAIRDDRTIKVSGGGSSAELEAAINADPELQKTLGHAYRSAEHAYELPAMKELFEHMRDGGHRADGSDVAAAWHAARDRVEASRYTLNMTQGVLTTVFVDRSGERFGEIAPQTA